jgi:hypothetical protein
MMEKKNVSLETFCYWPVGATDKKQANPEVGLFESCPVERLVLTAALLAVLAFLLGFHAALVLALLASFRGFGAALARGALGSRLLVFGLCDRDEGHCHGHNGQHFDELHTVNLCYG